MAQETQLDMQHVPTNKNLLIFSGALVILLIVSAFLYGAYVFAVAAVALISGGVVEYVFAKVRKLDFDISWIVSPLVLTLMLPPRVNLWVVSVATVFGVFFGKSVFGGLGKNIFNPAVVGLLFVTISFPSIITTAEWVFPSVEAETPIFLLNSGADVTATYPFMDLLLGQVPGAIGETFRLGIIILGVALIILKVSNWRVPVFYLGSVFIMTWIGHLISPSIFPDPIISLFVGSLLFAAFFVATDPVSGAFTNKGKMVFGFGLAFFTVLIRNFATFQEGVIFAIILMNAIAPLIDDMFKVESEELTLNEEATK
jgi:Na+-transporting NADH:ubiquinone oxidoreductase subunit B/electron transport complex protein RnfD